MEVVKLNVVTSTLIFFSSICDILYRMVGMKQFRYALSFLHTMYAVSNPIVYILSMSELKENYKKLIRKSFKRLKGVHRFRAEHQERTDNDPWANLNVDSLWAC